MKKNVIVVYIIILFTITSTVTFSGDRNLIRKGASFETNAIKMKLYIDMPELSQFPEWPEINAVAAPLEIDTTTSFDGSRSLKVPFSPFRQLKSGWLPVKTKQGTFTFSCYLYADKPNTRATLRISPHNKKAYQQDFILDTSWKRYSITTSFTDIAGPSLCCQLFFDQKKGTVWVDAIQFEQGELKPFTVSQPIELALSTEKTNNLFLTQENIHIKIEAYSKEISTPCQLYYIVSNWKGEKILSGKEKIMIEKGKTIFTSLNIGRLPRGWYDVRATLTDDSSQKIIDTNCVFISVINPLPPSLHDLFFGLHNHAFHHQFSSTMDILGAKWQRVFTSFSWSVVEPSIGKWRFPDRQVEDTRKHGQEILGVLGWHKEFKRCPAWGEFTESSGGSWRSKRPIPKNLNGWEKYVFKTVEHFKGKVDFWEVINEPNGWMSADEYLPLLKRAYKAAKQANPNCTVVGICTTADQGINPFAFAKEVIEKGGLNYCDVVSYHPYSRAPEDVIEWTQSLKKMIGQYSNGRDIPLWNTESGWSSPSCYEDMRFNPMAKSGIRSTGLSPVDVASYMVRLHVIMKSLGVEKLFFFTGWTKDLGIGIYSHGDTANLINFDDSPAPALPAYNAMVDILGKSNVVKIYRSSDGFASVYLFTSNNKYIAVAWNLKKEREYKISLPTNIVNMQLYDIMGNQIGEYKKQSDKITFILEDTPIYIIAPISERQKLEKAIELI